MAAHNVSQDGSEYIVCAEPGVTNPKLGSPEHCQVQCPTYSSQKKKKNVSKINKW